MKYKHLIAALLVMVVAGTSAHAQSWSGILAPSRAIDWSQAGVQGGIPNRTTVCTTLNPGATAAQINAAIASCPANQVVFLSAGNYPGLSVINMKSGVTLRGAGSNSTFLTFTSGSSCNGLGGDICVINSDANWTGDPHNVVAWTGGYAKGATSITLGAASVGSLSNLKVGSMLTLDQLNDASDPGMNIYVCGGTGACSEQGNVGNGLTNRQQEQVVVVTSINGSTIGITPGLYAPNWSASRSPEVWFSSALPLTGVGIENLSMDHRNTNINGAGIMFTNAVNSWVKGVRSVNNGTIHKHVWLYQTARITVRDSYFYGSNGTSESYGVDSSYGSSDSLVENNICHHISSCNIQEGASGAVFAYNYAIDDYYIASTNWMAEDAWHHSAGDYYVLFEGNIGQGIISDDIHGSSFMYTAFRNRWNGRDPMGGGTKTQQTNAVHLYSWSRFWNIVGNVMGTTGYHTTYQTVATTATGSASSSTADASIYVLNYSGNEGSYDGSIPNDMNTSASLLRWGNYDTVTAANQFQASEVPSSISIYANPVPASQTLPASFYLNSKPAWWGSVPWPAIGPDVSGGNLANTAGHVNKIPAQLCYENTSQTSGILDFNADTCFVQNRPAAPTNVTVLVQ